MSLEIQSQPRPPSSSKLSPKSIAGDIVGILIPLGILGLGASVLGYSIINRPQQQTTPEEKIVPKVQSVVAMPYQRDMEIDVDGIVVPHREIQLPTEVSGRIIRQAEHCRAGRFVTAGEVLFEIDPLDYELELKQLRQEQKQAQLQIDETNVDIANTKQLLRLAERDMQLQENDVRRMTTLSTRKAVAQSELDRSLRGQVTASNALQNLSNRVNLLEAKLNSARTSLELSATKLQVAKLNLDRTKITSPIDGVVVEENSEVDSFVQKGATLVTIEDTSAVEVLCNLRTDEIAWLWRSGDFSDSTASKYELPAAPADILFTSDGREYIWKGVVSGYDGIGLDVRTRTVPCRILVPDPTGMTSRPEEAAFDPEGISRASSSTVEDSLAGGPRALVRGMFVNVRIQIAPISEGDLLSVPIEAIRPGGKVWIIKDNRLQIRAVNIAKTLGKQVLIRREGTRIDPNDRIIVTPLSAAAEGMDVEEVTAS